MRGGRQSSSTDEDTTPAQSPDATTSSPKDTDSPAATTTTTSTTVVEKDQYFEAKVFTETPDGIVAPLEQPKVQLETDEPEVRARGSLTNVLYHMYCCMKWLFTWCK